MIRQFGRHYSYDGRDSRFRLKKFRTSRNSRYWRDSAWFGDQLNTPMCVGYAWAHWLVNDPLRQYVDPQGLYSLAQFVDEWEGEEYEGTSVRAAAKVIHRLGFIKEYLWATNLRQVIDAVLEIGPVVMGTEWHEGMMRTDHAGFIEAKGDGVGGHAWLLTGVNVKEQKFRLKNSWGRNWGLSGRAFIRFADLDRLISDRHSEACIAVEQDAYSSRKGKSWRSSIS